MGKLVKNDDRKEKTMQYQENPTDTAEREVYDAHVHYLWTDSQEDVRHHFAALEKQGLRGTGLIIMGYHLPDPERCLEFIPASYHDRIDPYLFAGRTGLDLPPNALFPGIDVFPYLDGRYLTAAEADLTPYRDVGYRGLKLLYVAAPDRTYKMTGWPQLFGKSQRDFEHLTARLIEQAAAFGWPVIFHVDLRLYADFVHDILRSFTNIPFILPHFGFTRRGVARLLEEYDNCHTDFSSLLPFMQREPDKYAGFINEYADRILFGSDAVIDWPELITEYIAFTRALIRDPAVGIKIMRNNYLRIHHPRPAEVENDNP
jgi:hypothetical protein